MSKSTATPAPQAFEPEFIAGLKSIFEEKIVFNQVLGLKITALAPDGVVGRIERRLMKWQPRAGETEKL